MKFKTFGPYSLEKNAKGAVAKTAQDRREFWDWIEDDVPGLSYACGVYIFSIKASTYPKPWYVGKAEKKTFRGEALTTHKFVRYDDALVGRKGIPQLTFIAHMTRNDKFRKPTTGKRRAVNNLESILIGMAITQNPELGNIRGTEMMRNIEIEGALNTYRLASKGPAKHLRDLIGL